ncbi:protein FAM92A isoform X1 [Octopus sinensis]|uniref:Protein FAM92A isoform X1 n=1 Tax=Octopus sinensis TaxID=2607531 RepID=A0A7E6FF55_9MOLL|nr:protein FAM92A isoform X1 [Octopus sinensis]
MNRSGAEITSSPFTSKFVQDRLAHVEKNFGDLCVSFNSYTRKTARIRDKGDEISQLIVKYVDKETLNPSSKKCLTTFAENLSTIQDYRQAEVQRLDANVLRLLSDYGPKCKQKKNELKTSFAAQEREGKKRQEMNKLLLRSPTNQHQIAQVIIFVFVLVESVNSWITAKSDYAKASVEATRCSKVLEKEMDAFELQKLTDMKKVLLNFVRTEMTFHCKALELYTICFQNLSDINVEEDLDEFRKHIHPPTFTSRMEIAQKASIESSPRISKPDSGSLGKIPQTMSSVMTFEDVDDDDDDDDDDDEDDDDDDDDEDDIEEDDRHTTFDSSNRISSMQSTNMSIY